MTKPNVPSVQHLVRNHHDDPQEICKALVKLADFPPQVAYQLMYKAIWMILVYNVPMVTIAEDFRRIKNRKMSAALLELLPFVDQYARSLKPSYVAPVQDRHYQVARNLRIPFRPPLIYGEGGNAILPWFIFWKTNPIIEEKLSLFVTIVVEIMKQDPDLETASFQIVDFSSPTKEGRRVTRVFDTADIPRLTTARKGQMLTSFAEGFAMARAEIANRPARGREDAPMHDPNQVELFQ